MHPDNTAVAAAAPSYLSADELLANAPKDLAEENVEAFGGLIKIRALTAAQQARIKQQSVKMTQRGANVQWAEMERATFQHGVVEPKMDADQVKALHMSAGESFAKVVEAIDRISGTNKEALRQAQEDFQDTGD